MSSSPPNEGRLSRYPLGSLRELCSITLPLMISLISVSLMQFSDRVFLSRYSLDALNSAMNGWMLAILFLLGGISTAGISEVFVGQYNGANKQKKIGAPIWQMIYFSLALVIIYVPLAIWGGDLMLKDVDYEGAGIGYFRYIMFFGPFFPLASAVSGFFVGRGHVKLVTFVSIGVNLVNIILDPILIFGYGPIPECGAKGAAIATGISQAINAIILFTFFIKKKNHEKYGVANWKFNLGLFKKCLWLGIPRSIAHILEMGAWTLCIRITYLAGRDYASVATVSQSFFLLTSFIGEAFSRGVTVVASNIMGAGRFDKVKKLWKSMIKLTIFFFIFQALIYVVFIDKFIALFLSDTVVDPEYIRHLHPFLKRAAIWFWLFFLFDCLLWGTNGFLTAAGDTRFVMWVSGITPWLLGLLPTYIVLHYYKLPPDTTMLISIGYAAVTLFLNALRLRSGKWKKQQVIG